MQFGSWIQLKENMTWVSLQERRIIYSYCLRGSCGTQDEFVESSSDGYSEKFHLFGCWNCCYIVIRSEMGGCSSEIRPNSFLTILYVMWFVNQNEDQFPIFLI